MKKENFWKFALLLVAISWGAGFPITKIALDSGMAPNAIMAIRFLLAALLIFIFFIFPKKGFIKRSEIKLGTVAGIILGIAFSLQTIGLKYTTPSKNAFLTGACVVMVPFLLWFFTKEKPKSTIYFSSIFCFLGIGILSLEGDFTIQYGDFLTLLSAFFFALQIALIGANIKNKNPIIINFFQMLSGGFLTLIFNILFENFSIFTVRMNKVQIMAVGFLVICNTLLAYLIQTTAQKYVSSSTATFILSTEIIFGSITSILFMGEHITWRLIIGGILIFGSILLAESDFSINRKKVEN